MSLLSSQSETHIKAYEVRKSFKKPQNWVLIFGWFLASCAGFVNTVAFLSWQMSLGSVQHAVDPAVCGKVLPRAGMLDSAELELGFSLPHAPPNSKPPELLAQAFGLVGMFVFGAFTCGLLIDKNQVHFGGKSWYGFALVLNGLLLITAALLPDAPICSCYLASMACGLQNAMCTSHFGAVVRTTHVTGTLTDIGSILGRVAVMHLRKGCRRSKFNVLEKAELGVDLRKLLVLLPMWVSFVMGSTFGALAESILGQHALFIPAFATTFLGVVYMTLRQVLSDLFQQLEQQSLREKLHEVRTRNKNTNTPWTETRGPCDDRRPDAPCEPGSLRLVACQYKAFLWRGGG
ncbi:unnamed protein product [Durusdinium trenchii]|uniref:Solute carrier family 40 protein n=1 Tax=Durusdinium trenchii TaxID=1381693 RepID=A0ABP0P051_9DINO